MSNITIKFTKNDLDLLTKFFEEQKCSFSPMKYAFFKATGNSYNAIFYTSGKLLIQGNDIYDMVKKLNETFSLNIKNDFQKDSNEEINEANYIGVDESGKGDYFGPLVIGGVAVNSDLKKMFSEIGVKDSKQLSDDTILKLSNEIKKNAKWSVVAINPQKYNELYYKFKNLNRLLAWGHARVIENILEKAPECTLALSDKFASDENTIKNALINKGKNIKLVQRTKGESDLAVAAASIIARAEFVSRVNTMSITYKINFPKGASDKVVLCAKEYSKMYSKDRLNEVAKLHFKTTSSV